MTVYVAGDVRAIQGYVFGSPRLLEMRGASRLLDLFDRRVVAELVKIHDGELGFSGGGNFLARFQDAASAAPFEEAVANAFLDLTGSDGLTLVRVEGTGEFPRDQERIGCKLRWAKRQGGPPVALDSMPFLRRCDSCGREAPEVASRMGQPEDDEPQWIGPVCARKREMHAAARTAAKQRERSQRVPVFGLPQPVELPPFEDDLEAAAPPKDFLDLVGDDDLGVVVADGNGLGDWFQELEWEAYTELSRTVDRRLRDALREAEEEAKALVQRDDRGLPVQRLIVGGDDLVAALPARLAVPFARALLQGFEVGHPTEPQEPKRLSAGVVLAKASFPFQQAHRLAEELLGRAKERSRREEGAATLDLLRVRGSHVQDLAGEIGAVERGSETANRWSYGASGPFTLGELDDLLALADALREVSPSQRGRLREILSPRSDGEHTPVDAEWEVPRRVKGELGHWVGRQDGEIRDRLFTMDRKGMERIRRVEDLHDGRRVVRLKLADALTLADLGGE